MKKRLISLVAASVLVGGMVACGTAHAGTVATKGDTNITVYGYVKANFNWAQKMADGNSYGANVAEESTASGAEKAKQNKVNFNSTLRWTRIGLKLKTPDIGVSGKIEADFGGSSGTDKALRLRKAYLQHNFDNYFIRVGKDDNLLAQSSYSWNPDYMPGFNTSPSRVSQMRIGGTFDLGQVSLIPELATQEMKKVVMKGAACKLNRTTMPGVAGKLTAKVKTYFGSPIKAYVGYGYEQVKLDASGDEKKKNPQIVTAGIAVPINWITLKADYNWFKGATKHAGLSEYTAPSFYIKGGDVKATKGHSVQGEVKITPIPQFAAWGGYAMTKINDASDVYETSKIVKKTQGWFIGGGWKTTKVTEIALEYNRFKTTYQDSSTATHKDKGTQYNLVFKYNF